MGVLAKTDKVDARVLRAFADVIARQEKRSQFLHAVPDEQRAHLEALVIRRRQLLEMRKAEANPMGMAHKAARKSLTSSQREARVLGCLLNSRSQRRSGQVVLTGNDPILYDTACP